MAIRIHAVSLVLQAERLLLIMETRKALLEDIMVMVIRLQWKMGSVITR